MVFSSTIFLFGFLPLVLILYFLAREKYRNYILLAFSLFFYAWEEPKFLIIMLGTVIIDYIMAITIDKSDNKIIKRYILVLAVIINIGILGYFKYTNFIVHNINNIFNAGINIKNIILPIGISFYIFQALSYVIDVFQNKVKVQRNFFYLLLYVSLFPQLIAGPIVRYSTIEKEIRERKSNSDYLAYGIKRFIIGLAKKVIIADTIGEMVDTIYLVGNFDTPLAWLFAIGYMLQIYFDFSAYSDMAIGLGKVFGFNFNENFDYPYISKSITEFWRRWHISLTTWFRDYIYIPLGGNQRGKVRQVFNMFIVWLVTGLWHGAAWNFILWGLYYFIILVIEKLFLNKILEKVPAVIRHIYAIILILGGWVLFRAENLSTCLKIIQNMFAFNFTTTSMEAINIYLAKYTIYLMMGIIFSIPIYTLIKEKINIKTVKKFTKDVFISIKYICIILLFGITILYLVNATYNPFIYFRF